MSDLKFRELKTTDLTIVMEIYNHYVDTSTVTFDLEPWTESEMEHKVSHIRELGLPFIVAEVEGDLVGYGYLSTWREKCAYKTTAENTLYLKPGLRGKGYGGQLLEELLRLGGDAGVREVIAVIADTEDAAPSVKLHERHGFKSVGAMQGVGNKFDRWIGVVMMQKSLK